MPDLTDVLTDADGNEVYYYDDGSQIVLSPDGTQTYNAGSASNAPTVTSNVTDSYGIKTVTYNDGTQTFQDSNGNFISLSQAASIAGQGNAAQILTKATAVATANGGVVNPDGSINFGNILTPQQKGQIISQLGNTGGQWLARQVGGSTVFYRNANGGFGSMDISKLLPFIAVGAALFLSSSK